LQIAGDYRSKRMQKKIVHVVGTGTIGEPLIGLLANFRERFGIDEVTFHKRTALLTDRSKVNVLSQNGARLCVDRKHWSAFKQMGMEPSFESNEAIDRASVVIDCTPAGNENKQERTIATPTTAGASLPKAASLALAKCMPVALTIRRWTERKTGSSRW